MAGKERAAVCRMAGEEGMRLFMEGVVAVSRHLLGAIGVVAVSRHLLGAM